MRLTDYLSLLAPHARRLALATVLVSASGAVPGIAVWLLRDGLRVVTDGTGRPLAVTLSAFVLLMVLHGVALVVRAALTRKVASQVASVLRRRLHARWLAEPAGTVGDRLSALLEEVDQVQLGVSALVTAVRSPISLVVLAVTALVLAPALAVPSIALLAGAMWLAGLLQRRVGVAAADARQRRAALAALAAEHLAGADVVRAFGAVDAEAERFGAVEAGDRRARLALEIARVLPAAVVQALAAVSLGLVLALGADLVGRGTLQTPSLVAFVAAVGLMARPLTGLTEVRTLMTRCLAALERVQRALEEPLLQQGVLPLPPRPDVLTLQGVTATFTTGMGLNNVAFKLLAGEVVGFVGPTGAGKTTLLSIAAGLRRPDVGTVLLGGLPLHEVHPSARSAAIAVLPQHPVLFARSVAENVALGQVPDLARVRQALASASVSFIGADAHVPDHLSGGEKTRICLARALYRNASVLVLDEPTAALDELTAKHVLEAVLQGRSGRITILATHDPAVVAQCDRVFRVGEGGVHELQASERESGWTVSSGS